MDIFANPKMLVDSVDNLTKYEDIIKAYECLSVEEVNFEKFLAILV